MHKFRNGEVCPGDALRCKCRHSLGSDHLQMGRVGDAVGVVGVLACGQAHEEVVLGGILAKRAKQCSCLCIHVDERHPELSGKLAHGGRVIAKRLREGTVLPDSPRDGCEENGVSHGGSRVVDIDGEIVLVGGEGGGVAIWVVPNLVVVAELDEDIVASGDVEGFGLLP
ncbi:hypothetical protein GOP47_0009133 [Adiantum capillus-veneris]|uniref:Uncharacterized protein n=1 Tax=Adiantum capillus-veneris TaxID=13818 RepID=A0A9D4UZV8_ADICA|nr:hypothetical protein GOP47_0009133 [Adiantum capillus-veneris]